MTTDTDVRPLTTTDLAAFDSSSVRLIRAMEAQGWWGRVSSRGHAIMHAPDGVTTSSVTRDHDKHRRTRQNAWAEFERWLRAQASTTHPELEEAPMATVMVCPDCQATFPNRDALRAHKRAEHHPMRPAMPCPDCGEVWWSAQALNLHLVKAHPDSPSLPDADPTPCPFPGCTYVGRSLAAMRGHHKRAHSTMVCPLCGDKVSSERGLKLHLSASHPEDKDRVLAMRTVAVKPTKVEAVAAVAPVGAPVVEDATDEDRNVVLDYLVNVTTGKDAEDMVAAIRAVIAPTLVDEVRKLREHNTKLEAELDTTARALGEANARLAILREAMGL